MSTKATPDLYGFDEFIDLHLHDLMPEQRLRGRAEIERVLSLPGRVLRALADDYIATLPADVQEKIRALRAAAT